MHYLLIPNEAARQGLSLLARSRARADSTYRRTEPATVRPPRAPWDYHRYPIGLN